MFDVGFWELLLVGLVALLAFGPNELPRLVRDTVRVVRRLRAAAAAAGDELRRELRLDELDQMPKPGSSLGSLKGVVDEVRQLAHEVRPPIPPSQSTVDMPASRDAAAGAHDGEASADNKASPIAAVSQNDEHA